MFPQLYHAHHSRYLEDIPFWLELAAQAGGPVLELGCGTGRVLLPLVEAGYRPIGVDLDIAMLKFMRGNFDGKSLVPPPAFVADICEFHLGAQFPLIIMPCNTFSTLSKSQQDACLACISMHLQSGGIFAVSIANPVVLQRLPARSETEYEDEFTNPLSGNPVQVSSSWRRSKDNLLVSWTYDHLLPDGLVEHLVVKTHHQLIPLEACVRDFQTAGLTVIKTYGGFDYSEYTDDSPHLIFMATRAKY